MTSVAWIRMSGGMSRLSASAVARLRTNPDTEPRSTGRSAGFARRRRIDALPTTTGGGVDRVLRVVPRISRALAESNSTPDKNGGT